MADAVHSTALVDPGARIHPTASIGAFSIIGPAVTVGADVEIGHHCVLEGRVELAPGVKIGHGSILGGRPQDLKFKEGTPSGVDRKSTRLNSSHRTISYAVFCLKKKRINCLSD